MSNEEIDTGRRRVLVGATTVVGAVGTGFLAVPFIASWQPSAAAKAAGAPVEIDISALQKGQMLTVEWRGKPVLIVRRPQTALDDLATMHEILRDPDSEEIEQQPGNCKNEHRSIKPEILVLIGLCTHLGCVPSYRPVTDVAPELGAGWKGGFYCPCHGSKFDLAGRVYKGVPAPMNLQVPTYRFLSESTILIGADGGTA